MRATSRQSCCVGTDQHQVVVLGFAPIASEVAPDDGTVGFVGREDLVPDVFVVFGAQPLTRSRNQRHGGGFAALNATIIRTG